MKTILWIALLFVVVSMATAQPIRLTFEQPPNLKGTMTWSATLLADGRKQTQSTLQIGASDRRTTIRMESVFAKDGAPIRMISETRMGANLVQRIVADFRDEGVLISGERAGKTLDQRVPYPEGATWKDSGEYWFLRDQPKVGQKLLTYRFSLEELRWRIQERIFVGKIKKKVNNVEIEGNLVRVDEGEFFLDARGDPILIETKSGATLRRVEK